MSAQFSAGSGGFGRVSAGAGEICLVFFAGPGGTSETFCGNDQDWLSLSVVVAVLDKLSCGNVSYWSNLLHIVGPIQIRYLLTTTSLAEIHTLCENYFPKMTPPLINAKCQSKTKTLVGLE